MSAMAPIRSAAGRNRTVTRSPVARASGPPASTTWSRAVSAPSRRIRAQANGVGQRVLGPGLGHPRPGLDDPARAHLDQLAGVLAGDGVVLGGRHDDRPARPRTPSSLPSRSPVRNAPMTGPTDVSTGTRGGGWRAAPRSRASQTSP